MSADETREAATSAEPPENAQPQIRELTVGQLIEQLESLPEHHYVSPMVDGVLGAGIAVWQMFDPQTHDTLVVFGEPKQTTSPIVPPEWSRTSLPARLVSDNGLSGVPCVEHGEDCHGSTPGCEPERPACNWPRCHRSPNPCLSWCKCRCHVRTPPAQSTSGGAA